MIKIRRPQSHPEPLQLIKQGENGGKRKAWKNSGNAACPFTLGWKRELSRETIHPNSISFLLVCVVVWRRGPTFLFEVTRVMFSFAKYFLHYFPPPFLPSLH